MAVPLKLLCGKSHLPPDRAVPLKLPRLKAESSQLSQDVGQRKLLSADGKYYPTKGYRAWSHRHLCGEGGGQVKTTQPAQPK